MKNIVLIISTLQECDVFFSFLAGLKDKNKELNIIIEPPKYTEITEIKHTPSLSKIKLLEGSIIHIKGLTNKKLKLAELSTN